MTKCTVVRAIAIAWVLIAAAAPVSARQGPAPERSRAAAQVPAKKAVPPGPPAPAVDAVALTQGFNVVLVLGDLEGGGTTPDSVPAAARKALADMKDFLPYKSYRLLDTAWILGANEIATSRLRGVDDREYELTLGAMNDSVVVGSKALRVSFQLRDPAGAQVLSPPGSATPTLDHLRQEIDRQAERRATAEREAIHEASDLERQRMALEVDLRRLRERYHEQHPDVVKKRAELDRLLIAKRQSDINGALLELRYRTADGRTLVRLEPRRIIDTGFTMDIGETVIVGTSRVGGDKAILALLTAVPRGVRK